MHSCNPEGSTDHSNSGGSSEMDICSTDASAERKLKKGVNVYYLSILYILYRNSGYHGHCWSVPADKFRLSMLLEKAKVLYGHSGAAGATITTLAPYF